MARFFTETALTMLKFSRNLLHLKKKRSGREEANYNVQITLYPNRSLEPKQILYYYRVDTLS